MNKRFLTRLTLIILALALTVAGEEEKPLSLEGTKWKLMGYVDAETNEIEEPDYSMYGSYYGICPCSTATYPNLNTDAWFTLEFAADSAISVNESLSSLVQFTYEQRPSFVDVNYDNSAINFLVNWWVYGPIVPADVKYFNALAGSQSFELSDNSLKIYYKPCDNWMDTCGSEIFGYMAFKPWEPAPSKVQEADRVVSSPRPSSGGSEVNAAILPPAVILSAAGLAPGPNPVAKSAGFVGFYRAGERVKSASLKVYDASGKTVGRIAVSDKSAAGPGRSNKRLVGTWNLKDAKGRPVAEGAYLVKGSVKTVGGGSEKIALLINVR